VDGGTCRLQSLPCKTITYALTQNTGDTTILVAAGQYPEQLTITAPVTIVGAGATTVLDPATLAAKDTDPNHSTSPYPFIDVNGATNVKLKNLAVDGSAAVSSWTGCNQNPIGVYYHNAAGSMVSVTVTNIQEPPALFGCQSGLGVYVASDNAMSSSVTMSKLTVSAFQKNGVTCRDAGTSCKLTGSHITGVGPTSQIAENGFEGYGVASITATGDTVSGDSYTGGGSGNQATGLLILDVGTVSATHNHLSNNDIGGYFADDGTGPSAGTWTISNNTVTHATAGSAAAGYGDGIVLDSTTNSVTVSMNTVKTNAEYGIALYGASNATVTGNTVSNNSSDGIYVGGPGSTLPTSGADKISSNTVTSNHGNGINADTSSGGNTFTSNAANFNVLFDLKDAGTGNMWTTNTCMPAHDSSPAGLC
jgi:parallel beta-helix repeat protein